MSEPLEMNVDFETSDTEMNMEADMNCEVVTPLRPATETTLGGIKVGENLSIAPDGTLSAEESPVDDTLTIAGAAADAKKTGDEITSLKEDLSESVGDLKSALRYESVRTRNLIDVSTLFTGELVRGVYNSTGDKYITDYFPVEANTRYLFSGNCTNDNDEIAFYDSSHTYITRSFGTSVLSPENAAFARVEFNKDVAKSLVRVQFEKNAITDYIFAYEAPDISMRSAIRTPEMYGAIGDGTADDTIAIASALSGGNVCLVGSIGKIYRIITPIALFSNTHIHNLNVRDSVSTGTSLFHAENADSIAIENVTVNTLGTIKYNSEKSTFLFTRCHNVSVINVKSIDTKSRAFCKFSACNGVNVNALAMNSYYEYGVACYDETTDINIENCNIKNCLSSENFNYAIAAYSVYGSETTTTAHFIRIRNNVIQNFNWTAIDTHGGYDEQIIGNTINQEGEENIHMPKIGINVGDDRGQCQRAVICDNNITGNNNAFAYAIAVVNVRDVIVARNVITNWSQIRTQVTTQATVFYLVRSEQVLCVNNVVNDFNCKLIMANGRNIKFSNNIARFNPASGSLFNDDAFTLEGSGEVLFVDNVLLHYTKFGKVRSTGRYNPHPVVKNNELTPEDVSKTELFVTTKDNITIEDFKYNDDEISTIVYGKYNDVIITKNIDGTSHQWICTKSYYSDTSVAEWSMI